MKIKVTVEVDGMKLPEYVFDGLMKAKYTISALFDRFMETDTQAVIDELQSKGKRK
jgi:hypothetical protein